MKRIAGVCALLVGLSGCFSFPGQAGPEGSVSDTKTPVGKGGPAAQGPVLPPVVSTTQQPVPMPPTTTKWANPAETIAPPQGSVDHAVAKQFPRQRTPKPLPQAMVDAANNRLAQASPAPMPPTPIQPVQVQPTQMQPATLPPGMPSAVSTPEPEPIERIERTIFTVTPETPKVLPVNVAKQPELPRTVLPPTPSVKSPTVQDSKSATAVVSPARMGTPLMRLVNTKRITLNFEVKDLGPSGLSAVELWYTQPGQEWKKYDAPTNASAYVVEVDEEGMYGFTLLAKSGTGNSKEPPQVNEQPQVWVIVDLSKPEVQLSDVIPSMKTGSQTVAIKWKATDKNLGRNPITLSYAEKEEGPWKVLAAGLENSGVFGWDVPKGTPARVLFKVEAYDLAGNVAAAQSSKAILMDNATPSVSIVNVQAQ